MERVRLVDREERAKDFCRSSHRPRHAHLGRGDRRLGNSRLGVLAERKVQFRTVLRYCKRWRPGIIPPSICKGHGQNFFFLASTVRSTYGMKGNHQDIVACLTAGKSTPQQPD